jgi:hypothetical protein
VARRNHLDETNALLVELQHAVQHLVATLMQEE